jgi:hypothetical protein
LIDLHNGLPCLDIGLECRAIWHGALVIVWALRSCHVYPNTGVKWLKSAATAIKRYNDYLVNGGGGGGASCLVENYIVIAPKPGS